MIRRAVCLALACLFALGPLAGIAAGQATDPDAPGLGVDTSLLTPLEGATGGGGDTQVPGTPGGRSDWLGKNGLQSPSCKGSKETACVDSGTRSIPAKPGHYDFDQWMESGTLGLPKFSNLMSELTGWVWSAIVVITATMFSGLEWALNLNVVIVGDGALGRLDELTESWGYPLAAVTLIAGMIWLATQFFGMQRRGEALASSAKGVLVAGVAMAVLASPSGTVGRAMDMFAELGRGAASAPLVIVGESTSLEGAQGRMWRAAIERPFALLEFGDVTWGTSPSKLDPRLVKEARRIAAAEGPHVQRRVEAAKTNAALMLVWPANSDQRNSKSSDKCEGGACLLHVLCGADDMKKCKGETAKIAEHRTESAVRDRAWMVLIIGIGMVAVWVILAAIVFGLLWTSITAIVTLVELAFAWPAALLFKPEWRQRVTGLLWRLLGAALGFLAFGIAAGLMMTVFLLTQRFEAGWLVQWMLSIVGLLAIWMRRSALKEWMQVLTSGQRTAAAGGGFASRLAASYATGVGLGALRGGGALKGAGISKGASAGGGGGVPTALPDAPAGGGRGGASRRATMLAAAGGGLVAGPVGSAVGAGIVNRGAIAGKAVAGADAVKSAGQRVTRGLERTAAGNSGPRGLAVAQQSGALLTGQQRLAQAAGQQATQQLPAAKQRLAHAERTAREAERQYKKQAIDQAQRARAQAARDQASAAVSSLQRAEQQGAAAAKWSDDQGQWTPAATKRAEAWLDTQAAAPTESRSYRQLAAMEGISSSDFEAMDAPERESLRERIDASLQARTSEASPAMPRSPLETVGRLAQNQRWRPAP